jgi:hypothetical protein
MSGDNRVIGLWPDRPTGGAAPRTADHDNRTDGADRVAWSHTRDGGIDDDADTAEDTGANWLYRLSAGLCLVAALAWTASIGWISITGWLISAPLAPQMVSAITLWVPPLILIMLLHMMIGRGHRANSRHYLNAAALLRRENDRLGRNLSHVQNQLLANRAMVTEISDSLLVMGEDAAGRMASVAQTMRGEVDTIATHTQMLRAAAASARADIAILLTDLPKARSESRKMAITLESAGLTAHEAAGKLDAQLASLTARGREADEITGGAAHKLAAHLARIESVSAAAGERLTMAASQMTQAVDAALDHAARAGDAARKGIDMQGAAMMALVDQSQAALGRAGADSATAIAMRIDDAHVRVEAMAALLQSQSETTTNLLTMLRGGLDGLDARLAHLDETSETRNARLSAALAILSDHALTLTGAFEQGTGTADILIGRAETLMTALDATTREIDEALPAAFARLDARAEASRTAIMRTAPDVARIEQAAASALDRLIEAESVLAKHNAMLDDFATGSERRLHVANDAVQQLAGEITAADSAARALAEGTSAQLVAALIRVRETAQTAADRAREAITNVIPAAAQGLSDAARDALTRTISESVTGHLNDLTQVAEHALATAGTASDRLMRQMLTIADTTAAVETRIADATAAAQDNDRDNFARRVALLIESLNSTAIDVTKILSNDVTDSAWAAYLRGDRGVFTRRAVRLLDAAEAREIVRHYDADTEFRAQVNRYIHDFESMLRNTLSTRDGSALSVTLLSSDMGKLYVALAQAIERLRS